jgi:hypothetical protein
MPASCPVKGNINAKGEGMTAGSLEMFLDRACGLRLDPEGFEMTSFTRTVRIKWTDVERFDLDSIRRTQIIRMDYAPHYQPKKIGRRLAWLVSR